MTKPTENIVPPTGFVVQYENNNIQQQSRLGFSSGQTIPDDLRPTTNRIPAQKFSANRTAISRERDARTALAQPHTLSEEEPRARRVRVLVAHDMQLLRQHRGATEELSDGKKTW